MMNLSKVTYKKKFNRDQLNQNEFAHYVIN